MKGSADLLENALIIDGGAVNGRGGMEQFIDIDEPMANTIQLPEKPAMGMSSFLNSTVNGNHETAP